MVSAENAAAQDSTNGMKKAVWNSFTFNSLIRLILHFFGNVKVVYEILCNRGDLQKKTKKA